MLNLKNDFAIDYSKYENVHNKLREINEERMKGRKKVLHHVDLLSYILEFTKDARQRTEVLLSLVASIFSSAKTATLQGFLTREAWVGAHNHVKALLVLLEDPAVSSQVTVIQKSKTSPDEELVSTLDIEKSVLPSLVSFLQNFDSELLKGF